MWHAPEGRRLRAGGVFAAPLHGLAGVGTAADLAWAAAVVVEGGEVVDEFVAAGTFTAPYQPGYLALRQLPLLERTVRALRRTPDVLLVNATGRDHPRRAGLALHLGAAVGIPTVGVTDRVLAAAGVGPGPERGDRSELRWDGTLVGFRLRTLASVRPVCVSAGWRTDPMTAAALVLGLCEGSRTPSPLREARRRAREARSRGRGHGTA